MAAPLPVVPTAAPPPMPARATPARPAADALTRIVAERGPAVPVIRATRSADDAASGGSMPARPSPLPSAPRLQVPTFADAMVAAGDEMAEGQPAARPGDETPTPDAAREEPLRPLAPRPITQERFNARALILTTVGLLVVAGIAYAAWRLRDKPESLVRSQAVPVEQQNPAKVATRAGDGGAAGAPADTKPTDTKSAAASTGAGAVAVASSSAPSAAATDPVPATTGEAQTQNAAQAAGPAPASPAPGDTAAAALAPAGAVIPVAQRAAFLIDAPDEPSKIKTFVGTVVWTADNASPVQDQPISRAVHAEVDVPEAGLKLGVVFQKNLEPQFPASHTLELRFAVQPGSSVGPVKQINVPQMRKDDSPSGDALVGLPVTITENYFLVGLSRGDAVARNLDLIKTRNWFDVPLLLTSGKVAKITFEKGATGQQVIDEVLQSWQ